MTPAPSVSYRDAADADIPRLLELLQQLSEQSRTSEAEVRPVTTAHHDALRALTSTPHARLIVMEDAGRIIGTLTLYLLPNLSHGGRSLAIVENVVIDQSLRGGGYGRALMAEAERRAQAAGCYKVSLTSNLKREPAHAFYERLGYTHSHKGFTRYVDDE